MVTTLKNQTLHFKEGQMATPHTHFFSSHDIVCLQLCVCKQYLTPVGDLDPAPFPHFHFSTVYTHNVFMHRDTVGMKLLREYFVAISDRKQNNI